MDPGEASGIQPYRFEPYLEDSDQENDILAMSLDPTPWRTRADWARLHCRSIILLSCHTIHTTLGQQTRSHIHASTPTHPSSPTASHDPTRPAPLLHMTPSLQLCVGAHNVYLYVLFSVLHVHYYNVYIIDCYVLSVCTVIRMSFAALLHGVLQLISLFCVS